jgi:hypothetical protein
MVAGSEVSRIAVANDGKTIYALDAKNGRLYKSNAGGYGWADISAGITGGGSRDELAVAPDDPKVVAIVTESRKEVAVSYDGGLTWMATGLAGKLGGQGITCIALSGSYGAQKRDIMVGTSTSTAAGSVWALALSQFVSSWTELGSTGTGWLPPSLALRGVDVFAMKLSPGYTVDGVVLLLAASGPPNVSHTYLYAGVRDFNGNFMTWDSTQGYPVEVSQPAGATPGTPLVYADLALPSDYSLTDIPNNHVYACWSATPRGTQVLGEDDVYRIDGTRVTRLRAGDAIVSLAYYGTGRQGKLLAGATTAISLNSYAVQVYETASPQSAAPEWKPSTKPPTGKYEARVAWSPDGKFAYCGTSGLGGGDQSAFSVSDDDGKGWNQIGLIDP